MPPPIDVCIRGAGIVGRTLALLLARERLRVGLVAGPEPAAGHSDVRAYALNTASRALLERVRAWPDETHATPVLGMEVHGDEGGAVRFSAQAERVAALAWIADVPALEQQLAEATRYQPGITLLAQPEPAALTVVCEGRASATRAEFGVQFEVTPYGQHAVAARLDCEKPHGQVARQWFADGEVTALLPLGGAAGNSVALVWSVSQQSAAALMALDPAAFEERLQTASHAALGRLTLASERNAWPLQLARADHWCGAGWVLAGDAAHNVHPLAGQGLNLGLADVRELAQVLQGREYWRSVGDAKLLRRYERARKPDVLAMGLATDGLQQLFARTEAPWAWARNWGMKGFERSGPLKHWVARQAMGRL
ncbi:FAD-dependent monooxygenase [Ramlibacter sp.]|uniref:FAD-dependent monooxygenase n=1 Tax=Ramlibacter sp. TaxID=1917967 RepID=UPI0017B69CDA|nr:FAD-dependent monooxygenase [Ramlibacter sp.]MBA2674890.1 FAD-dependent monooxygenase [Ramlibacter sp.]